MTKDDLIEAQRLARMYVKSVFVARGLVKSTWNDIDIFEALTEAFKAGMMTERSRADEEDEYADAGCD